MTALRAIELAVGYSARASRTVVLEGLNLTVAAGELVGLLGPNGIGKSTLLRTLSKVQPALAGSIEIDGVSFERLSSAELARRIGVVLTERPAIGALPAYRLVELGRYPHVNWLGQLTAHDHDVVDWAIDSVSVRHLIGRDSNTLSDGERQRFMIARALAQEPSVLLLDEPTAFLDVASRVELMGLLRRLARDEGLAVILSTHDLELALRMADTVWLIGPDRFLHSGVPEDLILAGTVERVFSAKTIQFYPNDRIFRPVTGTRGCAAVKGEGLDAILTGAVLEREGFEVVRHGSAPVTISVTAGATWEVTATGDRRAGRGFRELAELLRSLAESVRNSTSGVETNAGSKQNW